MMRQITDKAFRAVDKALEDAEALTAPYVKKAKDDDGGLTWGETLKLMEVLATSVRKARALLKDES